MSYTSAKPIKRGFTLGKAYSIWLVWLLASVALVTSLSFATPLISKVNSLVASFDSDFGGIVGPLAIGSYVVLSIFTFWFPILATGSRGRMVVFIGILIVITAITVVVLFTTFGDFAGLVGTGTTLAMTPIYIAFPYLTAVGLYILGSLIFWPREPKSTSSYPRS